MQWTPEPASFKAERRDDSSVTLKGADSWAWLRSGEDHEHVELSATFKITQASTQFRFFGESWSVWPDRTFGDQGFEIGLLLRGDDKSGYRVQFSHKLQQLVLVKYPDGGFLRSVPCDVKLNQPHVIRASVRGNVIAVSVDGHERLRYVDSFRPLERGRLAVGTSSRAVVTVEDVQTSTLAADPPKPANLHSPAFSARQWIGGRQWIFDGDEPILLLPAPESSTINNVKLRPGYKPQLSWNSHWDTQNQGAYKEAENATVDVRTSGGGESIVATWRGKHAKDRFATRTKMTVGFDARRNTYTYDIDSELEVFAGEPFHFRYGYDFEHHTPLDPFNWQHLVVKRKGGSMEYRPVYPIDPGPMSDLDSYHGLRMWFGRHNEEMLTAPAIEYDIADAGQRKLNTAVCAAFYDTGVSFAPETAKPGTLVRVKYRYTGYPADEARAIFERSKLHESPMLDPNHHYIFPQWPKVTFDKFEPMSRPWWNDKLPFSTAHNQRPTYALATGTGIDSGHAMRLGPGAFGKAGLPIPATLPAGRYVLTAMCKSANAHGPGGRIELEAVAPKANKPMMQAVHYVGNGSFDWKAIGFAFDVPQDAGALSLAMGNAGTGEVHFAQVEFRRLESGATLPANVLASPNATPPKLDAAPAGAIADYRMEEGRGLHVFDYARGPFGMLELANVGFVVDEGRPAIRVADGQFDRPAWPRSGWLERGYFGHEAYQGRQSLPIALAGHHGGGFELKALTMAAWIKPAAEMGKSTHGGKGDIAGVGARRFILGLQGQRAPYQLTARLNVNDVFTVGEPRLDADRWHHVAMTCEPDQRQWRVKLYINGKPVHEGTSQKFAAPTSIPPSMILGAELFYMHDAYYRGLVGRTLVFDKALSPAEVEGLASKAVPAKP